VTDAPEETALRAEHDALAAGLAARRSIDLVRRGAVVVWEDGHQRAQPEEWRRTFGSLDIQPTLVLARQTLHKVAPARVVFAFVPPRP